MSYFQLALIALVQGITEWLPISSSAHVLLAADFFGMSGEEELLINAMAHLGTLGSLLVYFWKDFRNAIMGAFGLFRVPTQDKPYSDNTHLALMIIIATLAAIPFVGTYKILASEALNDSLRNPWVIAASTIFFGALLWWADIKGAQNKTVKDMTLGSAAIIGFSQVIAALIPGTSRSGITMTASRALGIVREDAARYSMLIGAPILAASGLVAFMDLADSETTGTLTLNDGLVVALLSFVSGWASIAFLMALIKRMSFLPFVIYRFALGGILLFLAPSLTAAAAL